MTATDELRRLLDERGIEYIKNDFGITWSYYNDPHTATESIDGTLIVTGLTPEQAVEATLGRGTCENVGYYIDYTRFKCSACGYNGWTRYAAYGEDRVPRYCPNCGREVVGS